MSDHFTSSRIHFRPLVCDDVGSKYVAWLTNPEVVRFLEARHVTTTIVSCREYVAVANATNRQFLMGMFDIETSRHIGNIKIGLIDYKHMSGDLSLFIGEENFRNKGYGAEAIARVTRWGFDQLKLEKIGAGCYDRNVASMVAFLKSGYVIEGYFQKQVHLDEGRIGVIRMGIISNDLK